MIDKRGIERTPGTRSSEEIDKDELNETEDDDVGDNNEESEEKEVGVLRVKYRWLDC